MSGKPPLTNLTFVPEMTLTSLTFEELDALLALIEFHDVGLS